MSVLNELLDDKQRKCDHRFLNSVCKICRVSYDRYLALHDGIDIQREPDYINYIEGTTKQSSSDT